MKIRLVLLTLLGSLALLPACHAQFGPTRTTIRDSVLAPSGRATNGTLTVTASNAFRTYDGWNVGANTTRAKIKNGVFQIALAPNLGGTPFGSYYTAQYNFNDGTYAREYWVVPSESTVIPLSSVRAEFVDPTIMIAASQFQPPFPCTANQVLQYGGIATAWQCVTITGLGTVTSVGLTVPSIFGVTGSPITAAGTFNVTLNFQSPNQVFAGPASGSPAAPTFRALVAADIPDLSATYVPRTLTINGHALSGNISLASTDLTDTANLVRNNASNSWTAGTQDFSSAAHTLPFKTGLTASKPSTCGIGEKYFATDATAGQNDYSCTAANTWTQDSGGGGGGSNNPNNTANPHAAMAYSTNGGSTTGEPDPGGAFATGNGAWVSPYLAASAPSSPDSLPPMNDPVPTATASLPGSPTACDSSPTSCSRLFITNAATLGTVSDLGTKNNCPQTSGAATGSSQIFCYYLSTGLNGLGAGWYYAGAATGQHWFSTTASPNTDASYDGASIRYNLNATLVASLIRRTCDIAIGDESASSVIASAQLGPQKRMCYIPSAATIVEMDVSADAGTPNVYVARNHAGTTANIVSSPLATGSSGAIACANTGGTIGIDGATTCSATLQNTSLAAGDYLELASGTAGGTAKLMTIHVIYTVTQ